MSESGYVRTVVNGVPVVATPVEIDITTAGQLRAVLLDVASGGHPRVIVDMTRTQFCDSTGLSALIRTYEHVAAEDRELRLVLPAEGIVPYIMALTGVDRFIPCFASIEEALVHSPDDRRDLRASGPEALLRTLLGEPVARADLNPRGSGLASGHDLSGL
ncbi:MAG TPA: STAS domain-containing protein [Streptosporangiaceae bacterium]